MTCEEITTCSWTPLPGLWVAPWKRVNIQVHQFKVLILTVAFKCKATNSVRFNANNGKYSVCQEKKKHLVKPQPSGQRASVKSAKWDAKAKMLLPTFPTILRMKKRIIKKTCLNTLVNGHSCRSKINNLDSWFVFSRLTLVFTPARMGKQRHTSHAKRGTSAGNNK